MELVPCEDNESDDHVEILDSLPLGAIRFDDDDSDQEIAEGMRPEPDWRENYPLWCMPGIHPRREIGDCYARVACSILTTEQPYPGDEIFDPDRMSPTLRFEVKRQYGSPDYYISDRLIEFRTPISKALLATPQFDISRWYATRRSQALRIDRGDSHHFPMGHAVNMVAAKLLVDGIAFKASRILAPTRSLILVIDLPSTRYGLKMRSIVSATKTLR